jgi:hypothetical protein
MPRTTHVAAGASFWELADFFRRETPTTWTPRSIAFEAELATVRAAGRRWEIEAGVEVAALGHGQVELVVNVSQARPIDIRALTAARRGELFRFFERIERTMWRRRFGFGGRFHIDTQDDMASGCFNKFVSDVPALRREIDRCARARRQR